MIVPYGIKIDILLTSVGHKAEIVVEPELEVRRPGTILILREVQFRGFFLE